LQAPTDITRKEYERIRSYLENNREAILEDIIAGEAPEEAKLVGG
jgi:hypothetical protein